MNVEPFITTATGQRFYALAAEPTITIEDIAAALSKVCRYGGHCRRFYSVAEHSVLVSRIMEHRELGDPLEGLLHDATEAYLSDVVGPFKQLLPDYLALEAKLERDVRRVFGLPPGKTAGCKEADLTALMVEGRTLLPERGESMILGGIPAKYGAEADRWIAYDGHIVCQKPADAENAFAIRYWKLGKRAA